MSLFNKYLIKMLILCIEIVEIINTIKFIK